MIQHNGLALAYIGDAAYELLVREHLLSRGDTKVEQLHNKAVMFTSAEGQANAYTVIEHLLTEDEVQYFKRGRNAKTDRKPKNASVAVYRQATGFEALIGYLHLTNQSDRIEQLFHVIVKHVDK